MVASPVQLKKNTEKPFHNIEYPTRFFPNLVSVPLNTQAEHITASSIFCHNCAVINQLHQWVLHVWDVTKSPIHLGIGQDDLTVCFITSGWISVVLELGLQSANPVKCTPQVIIV